jgi:hypothetical protein
MKGWSDWSNRKRAIIAYIILALLFLLAWGMEHDNVFRGY